jgi:hypothetical protein
MTRDSGRMDVGGSFAAEGCAGKLSRRSILDVNYLGARKMYRRHWFLQTGRHSAKWMILERLGLRQ